MLITNVVIEREYGAGGAAVAQRLSERLGWTLWDRQMSCEIAARLKCSVEAVEKREERLDPTFYRLARIFMRGSYEEAHVGTLELLDAEHLALHSEKIIKEIAGKGKAVIVGRGAPWFLRGRTDTFSAFIYAPFDEKVERLVASRGVSRTEAERLVETVDVDRAAFVKKYFQKTFPLRELYNLMINSHPGIDYVADTIISQIDRLNDRMKADSATLV